MIFLFISCWSTMSLKFKLNESPEQQPLLFLLLFNSFFKSLFYSYSYLFFIFNLFFKNFYQFQCILLWFPLQIIHYLFTILFRPILVVSCPWYKVNIHGAIHSYSVLNLFLIYWVFFLLFVCFLPSCHFWSSISG